MCVSTDLAAPIPTRPVSGVKKAAGVKEVQLSPKLPSRGTELGPLPIPRPNACIPACPGSASVDHSVFIMAWKELKEHSPLSYRAT